MSKVKGILVCPSYQCKPGTDLFGIVDGFGKVKYLYNVVYVDSEFVSIANRASNIPPEFRFRFAGRCVECACSNWDVEGENCNLIVEAISRFPRSAGEKFRCAISNKCRWKFEHDIEACAICENVKRG